MLGYPHRAPSAKRGARGYAALVTLPALLLPQKRELAPSFQSKSMEMNPNLRSQSWPGFCLHHPKDWLSLHAHDAG